MANAEVRLASAETLDTQLGTLPTGEQLVVASGNGTHQFAGRELALAGFSGVVGFSSQVAYLLVIEGEAQIGNVRAGRGRMLLVPPFGGEVLSERFDAARLHDALETRGASPILAALDDLASEQVRGVFLGRLGRTAFNVTTMGSVEQERTRRAVVGGDAVRALRFDADVDASQREQRIAAAFLAALAAGDVGTVAQLLDPLPFGDAVAAREAMARGLVREHDWRTLSRGDPEAGGDAVWLVRGGNQQAEIRLRRTLDFAFVESVRVGE